ncbi:MAG: lipoate--protein ligase family protein [Propionibacteriaceae bacterium]|jgi:lipoate-protein ligase A|nr:lipoate--protein ligase family protein [Propionibacteriaceae bacterium]
MGGATGEYSHGEYKVPGGKLVAADVKLDPAGALIEAVRLAGDFFLEPDEALGRIAGALAGAPATEPASSLARRVNQALLPNDVLVGFDALAVAMAVRRALGHASAWADHRFELIEDGPRDPYLQMALDQVYAEELAAGRRGPTLRFWQWASNAVIIGSYQSWSNEVDPQGAARHDVTVVRRVSGGGAMFVEPGNTITYSLVVPASLVDGLSFQDSYAFLDAWCVGALRELGIAAVYEPINDIASPAGKIAGAAQKRFADGTVLHHVTMAYDIDAAKMTEVLRIGREKLSDKGTVSAAKRVDPLRSQTGRPREEILAAFIAHFEKLYALTRSRPTEAELTRAEDLVRTKFATPEWLRRIP